MVAFFPPRPLLRPDLSAVAELHAASFDTAWNEAALAELWQGGMEGWVVCDKNSVIARTPDLFRGAKQSPEMRAGDCRVGPHGPPRNDEFPLVAFLLIRAAADEAEILSIATHADSRRHGLAAALLAAAITDLAARDIHSLFLDVRADNAAAQALYAKMGFTVIATRRGYYALPDGSSRDALVLRKMF